MYHLCINMPNLTRKYFSHLINELWMTGAGLECQNILTDMKSQRFLFMKEEISVYTDVFFTSIIISLSSVFGADVFGLLSSALFGAARLVQVSGFKHPLIPHFTLPVQFFTFLCKQCETSILSSNTAWASTQSYQWNSCFPVNNLQYLQYLQYI